VTNYLRVAFYREAELPNGRVGSNSVIRAPLTSFSQNVPWALKARKYVVLWQRIAEEFRFEYVRLIQREIIASPIWITGKYETLEK